LRDAVAGISEPGQLADVLASFMDIEVSEKQRILEAVDVVARLDQVLWFVSYRLEVLRLSRDIGERTRQTIEGRQREHILREQLNTIQKELGEGEEGGGDVSDLAKPSQGGYARRGRGDCPEGIEAPEADAENAAEYSMLHSYLEWLSELPWQAGEGEPIDIAEARKVSRRRSLRPRQGQDADHRISRGAQAESDRAMRRPLVSSPARRGKTSLGQSIAGQ